MWEEIKEEIYISRQLSYCITCRRQQECIYNLIALHCKCTVCGDIYAYKDVILQEQTQPQYRKQNKQLFDILKEVVRGF